MMHMYTRLISVLGRSSGVCNIGDAGCVAKDHGRGRRSPHVHRLSWRNSWRLSCTYRRTELLHNSSQTFH